MLVVRGRLLAGSYFNQDDFYMTGRAYRSDLTWDYLFSDFAGHVNPFQQLSLWLVAHHAPYDWAIIATAILLVDLAATVLVWLIVSRLLGERWSRVVLLAVFAWAPMTLVPTLWWSAAMFLWPHVLCSLAAIWLLVRWHQGDGRPWVNGIGIVLVTAVALLWHERAVLVVPLVFGVAVALIDDASGWRRLPAALRRYRWLWLGMARRSRVLPGRAREAHRCRGRWRHRPPAARRVLVVRRPERRTRSGRRAVGRRDDRRCGGAGHLGHRGQRRARGRSVAGLLLWRGGPARRWGLAVLVGYVAADLALLLAGRSGFGEIIGLDPRYSSDTLHAAVVCVALCLRDAPAWPALATTRRQVLAVGGLLASYGVAAAFGTALLVPHFQNELDREFVTHLRDDLAADPTQVIVDGAAPPELVLPLVGDDNRYSVIFGPLPELPAFDEPSQQMRVIGEDGHLHPVELAGGVTSEAGPDGDCGYAVTSAGDRRRDAATARRSRPVAGPLLLRDRVDGRRERRRLAAGVPRPSWPQRGLAGAAGAGGHGRRPRAGG